MIHDPSFMEITTRARNAAFSSNPKFKGLFINSIFDCNLKMSILLIGMLQKYFDHLKFTVDKDLSVKEWTLIDVKAIGFR